MSPTTRYSRGVQPVRTLHSTSPRRASSAILRRSASAGRLRSPRRGHSTCLPSRPASHESSTENRWSKLQQDLACHAHMHGYTTSHALSKCYCTRQDAGDAGISLTGTSRIVSEPCIRKTRIPPRWVEFSFLQLHMIPELYEEQKEDLNFFSSFLRKCGIP